jgi:hypothetical protein
MAGKPFCFFLLIALALAPALSAESARVDLELVLSADSSGSIDDGEFALQRQGYAAALTHPKVLKAIRSGRYKAIAVTFVEWSGYSLFTRVAGWHVIRDEASARAFAKVILDAPRTIFGGGTALGGAIDVGAALLRGNDFEGTRRIIDVSGDGYNNHGRPPASARADALAQGITINGLAIINFDETLEYYFRTNVIGGPGAFVVQAAGFEDFARAVLRKLILELNIAEAQPRSTR